MYDETESEFSTADADYPRFTTIDGDLVVRFSDWQEDEIELRFVDTAGFAWHSIDDSFDLSPDRIYTTQPTLCPEMKESGKQWRLCFNAYYMCLDVQFSSVTTVRTQKGSATDL